MSNVLHSRFFRLLVCLVLVLSFLVNLSPLKAEATAVAGAVLSFEGLMSVLYSMGIGIVATELTVEAWNKIGNSLTEYITETGDSTITEVWIDLEAMYDSYIPGGGQDPDDELKFAEKLKHGLSRGLLAAIAGWLCSVVKMGGYEVEGEVSPVSWSYYGDLLLPTLPQFEDFPYVLICYYAGSTEFWVYYTDVPVYYDTTVTSEYYGFKPLDRVRYKYSVIEVSDINNWNITSSIKVYDTYANKNNTGLERFYPVKWANYNILSYQDGATIVVPAGPQPSSTKTEIIEPSIYVGDIPQQIKDGEKDKDTLILPPMDPFRVIQSPDTALDDLNQLQQQLQNGSMTVDQYVQQVQLQDPVTPDPSVPADPTTPSVDPEPWEPPSDPGKFALDLSKVFPFCIPFDLYAFLTCLNADPVTPVIHWEIAMPGGGSYPLTIDLSPFDSTAQLLRRLELLLFIVGLAIKTRDLIKG